MVDLSSVPVSELLRFVHIKVCPKLIYIYIFINKISRIKGMFCSHNFH